MMTRLRILCLAGAAFLGAGCGGTIAATRSTAATTPTSTSASSSWISMVAQSAPPTLVSRLQTSIRVTLSPTPDAVRTALTSQAKTVRTARRLPAGPRNRLIGPGLDVGVSIYSDCTGRSKLTRRSAAIDTCMTWDVYFIGHSFGGPFTVLTHAHNGETLTWYNAAGVARRFTIEGHQYTHAYGRADIPPRGTTAQFQTCLTSNGSRIITYYAVSP